MSVFSAWDADYRRDERESFMRPKIYFRQVIQAKGFAIPHGKWFAKKLRKPARSKGAKTAHLLRACFCNFCKPILFRYIILAALLVLGNAFQAMSQNLSPNADSAKNEINNESEKNNQTSSKTNPVTETSVLPVSKPNRVAEKSNTTDDAKADSIKVVFDDNKPEVMIVESNGKKYRIDSTKKTVELLDETTAQSDTATNETVAKTTDQPQRSQDKSADKKQTDEQEEGEYDFDPGFEPYDYRLVNVPTPKRVPKGSWNLSFTHRFSQKIHPVSETGRDLLGFDSFSVSAFGISYGITDKLYISGFRSPLCQKGLCKTIELGIGYQWVAQSPKSPFALTTFASMEGNQNFTEEYTWNLQAMMSYRFGKRVYVFFSPAAHINANGQKRFNPRPEEFNVPPALTNAFKLPTHSASFGLGTTVLITPTVLGVFEFTPRVGFKLGQVNPIFDNSFNITGFKNTSYPSIGFGVQKNIGKHSFTITLSNTQTSTTSRYNSSNLLLKPHEWVIGFNLFRRW
jgi:hypothetical protein